MSVVVIGLNHRTMPLDLFERMTIDDAGLPKALHELVSFDNLSEAVVLSTCNRTEVYAVAERFHGAYHDIRNFFEDTAYLPPEEFVDHLYVHYDREAVRYLFAVTSGLDSAVGELPPLSAPSPPRLPGFRMAASRPRHHPRRRRHPCRTSPPHIRCCSPSANDPGRCCRPPPSPPTRSSPRSRRVWLPERLRRQEPPPHRPWLPAWSIRLRLTHGRYSRAAPSAGSCARQASRQAMKCPASAPRSGEPLIRSG